MSVQRWIKQFLVIPTIGLAISLTSGCKTNSSNSNPRDSKNNPHSVTTGTNENRDRSETDLGGATAPRSVSVWKVQYISKCENTSPEKCLGKYGFSVSSNGHFKIGPAPDGQTLEGELEGDELKSFKQLVETGEQQPLSAPTEKCTDGTETSADELIRIISPYATPAIVRNSRKEFCYTSLSLPRAKRVEQDVSRLVERYYPSVFPNPCTNVASSLIQLYETMKECEIDSDCAYIDQDFQPIFTSDEVDLEDGECHFLKPLLVGNSFSVTSNQLKLLIAYDSAQSICNNESRDHYCSNKYAYRLEDSPPVCVQKICQINPSLERYRK